MSNVVFVTGNQDKANHLARLLAMPIDHEKIELTEIQSTSIDEIVAHKLVQAYAIVNRPVLVEDVSLGFGALSGLPGPFIKFFVDQPNGLEVLCRMLDGFDDKSAVARCVFGYYDGDKVILFADELTGDIAEHPDGDGGYGWDAIFCPDGHRGKTSAQLSASDYDVIYRKIKSIDSLRNFLIDKKAQ